MRGWTIALGTTLVFAMLSSPGLAALTDGAGGRVDKARPESAKPDYPEADWSAANPGNYTEAARPDSDPINKVVIHTMQGSFAGTEAWFKNPASRVTTHYIIGSKNGNITQMVHESDIAWHAGNWGVNTTSIGIEHEGYMDDPETWYTDQMYESSARLVRSICERYDIPMDRKHIIGHDEVPDATHTDPGKGWDWDKYMKLVATDVTKPITLDNASKHAVYGSGWDTSSFEGNYKDDYAYASPAKQSDPLWFNASLPMAGKYKVEIWYPSGPEFNDHTPYLVRDTEGLRSVYVDQRTGGGEWVSIGTFDLAAGDYSAVGVSRWTNGTGRVAADAVRLTMQ